MEQHFPEFLHRKFRKVLTPGTYIQYDFPLEFQEFCLNGSRFVNSTMENSVPFVSNSNNFRNFWLNGIRKPAQKNKLWL